MTDDRTGRIQTDRTYPVTPETRDKILDGIGRNLGRNAIAREIGIPGAYVTEVAKSIGHTWHGSPIAAAAMEARTARIRETRARVEEKLWAQAEKALDDMEAPTEIIQFEPGFEGDAGEFRTHLIPEPSFGDRRNLATVAGIMVQRGSELAKYTSESPESVGGGIVDNLAAGLHGLAELLRDGKVNPTEPPSEDIDVEADIAEILADPNRPDGDAL